MNWEGATERSMVCWQPPTGLRRDWDCGRYPTDLVHRHGNTLGLATRSKTGVVLEIAGIAQEGKAATMTKRRRFTLEGATSASIRANADLLYIRDDLGRVLVLNAVTDQIEQDLRVH